MLAASSSYIDDLSVLEEESTMYSLDLTIDMPSYQYLDKRSRVHRGNTGCVGTALSTDHTMLPLTLPWLTRRPSTCVCQLAG